MMYALVSIKANSRLVAWVYFTFLCRFYLNHCYKRKDTKTSHKELTSMNILVLCHIYAFLVPFIMSNDNRSPPSFPLII